MSCTTIQAHQGRGHLLLPHRQSLPLEGWKYSLSIPEPWDHLDSGLQLSSPWNRLYTEHRAEVRGRLGLDADFKDIEAGGPCVLAATVERAHVLASGFIRTLRWHYQTSGRREAGPEAWVEFEIDLVLTDFHLHERREGLPPPGYLAFEQALLDDPGNKDLLGVYSDFCADHGWETREALLRAKVQPAC